MFGLCFEKASIEGDVSMLCKRWELGKKGVCEVGEQNAQPGELLALME